MLLLPEDVAMPPKRQTVCHLHSERKQVCTHGCHNFVHMAWCLCAGAACHVTFCSQHLVTVCVALVIAQALAEKMLCLLRWSLDAYVIHEIAWSQADDQQLSSERWSSPYASCRHVICFGVATHELQKLSTQTMRQWRTNLLGCCACSGVS